MPDRSPHPEIRSGSHIPLADHTFAAGLPWGQWFEISLLVARTGQRAMTRNERCGRLTKPGVAATARWVTLPPDRGADEAREGAIDAIHGRLRLVSHVSLGTTDAT